MSNNISETIPSDIVQLEDGYFDTQPDVIIQNVLPEICDFQYGSKNIALCYAETSLLRHTPWPAKINLLDELWVATQHEYKIFRESGVNVPINLVPTPFNPDNLDLDIEPLNLPPAKDKFVFYFIGEYIPRKNLGMLVQAFHREFYPTEPVVLVLKLNKSGMSDNDLTNLVTQEVNKIKFNMRLYQQSYAYLPEVIISSRLTTEEINKLHKLGDCFVMPSCGESMCRPVVDAMYMGNHVIVTDNTGMVDTIGNFGAKAASTIKPVYSVEHPLPYLYTGRELWSAIDIMSLQKAMRHAFHSTKPGKSQTLDTFDRFSYQTISKKLESIL